MTKLALRYTPIVLLIAAWELLSRTGVVAKDVLPAFSTVMLRLWELCTDGQMLAHIGASMFRICGGLALGITVGSVLGFLLAASTTAQRLVQPSLTFLYPLPKSALIPIIIIWLGFGNSAQIAVIFLGTLLPIVLGAYNGAKGVENTLIWSARSLGASVVETEWQITFRAALPDLLSGIRVALALSFVLLIGSEMIGAQRGMGYLIAYLGDGGDYAGMFAAAFVITAIGFAADRGYLALYHYLLRYREA
ncbi:MAG TPA: ABC transporter permease [Stellaceae bacterium]|nr:ABC transporter permease [Stellaceae bacterium]